MRYGDQMVTMAVVADRSRINSTGDVMTLIDLFAVDYSRRYGSGSQSPEAGIRITTIRVASFVEGETVRFDASLPAGAPTRVQPVGTRTCHFPGVDGPVNTPVYDDSALQPGHVVDGPAVVTAETTTYLVEPDWQLRTGAHGAIWFLKNTDLEQR